MIPYILAVIGGYLLGTSTEKFDDGGVIRKARITKMPEDLFDEMPKIYVTYDDGIEEFLFDFYPDEINFTPEELIGLTKKEAINLKYKKDLNYLRSSNTQAFANGGYIDLSKQKPLVLNDSLKQLPEFELKKIGSVEYLEKLPKITGSKIAYEIFLKIWNENQIEIAEHFNVLLLNKANKPIGFVQVGKGGIDGVVADVEIICKYAVDSLAKGVIVAHNHPSGNLTPSQSDLLITKQLKDALNILKISLLDSMIITKNSYYSFADEGEM